MPVASLEFSIVIPTYNRTERLQLCLQSIAQLDYPRRHFEVIVVDDGSRIPIKPITDQFADPLAIRLIKQKNAGPASARNTGAAEARGNYLVFTDDDCQPDANWLQAVATARNECPQALIGGHTVNALSQNLYSTASQLLIDYLYDYYNQDQRNSIFFASNNFAMPRQLFHKVGGFETHFPLAAGEDREFCDRWRHHGFTMYYSPAMEVYHAHTLTLGSFWRQHFNYGRGAFCFHQIRAKREENSIQVEPLSFYINLLTYPFAKLSSQPKLLISGLFFLSQVANVMGFAWERTKQQRRPESVQS